MKTKFNSNDDLPSGKTLEMNGVIIAIRSVFDDGNKKFHEHFWTNVCKK